MSGQFKGTLEETKKRRAAGKSQNSLLTPGQWKRPELMLSPPHAVGRLKCRLAPPADPQCPSLRVSASHRLCGPGSLSLPWRILGQLHLLKVPPEPFLRQLSHHSVPLSVGEVGVVGITAQESESSAGVRSRVLYPIRDLAQPTAESLSGWDRGIRQRTHLFTHKSQ